MKRDSGGKNEFSPVVLVLILLFFLFPPLAIVGTFALVAYRQAKKNGQGNNKEWKAELEGIKRSGMAAKEKFLRPTQEDAAQRPYQSGPHAHTPSSYSYDACAQQKRLEQLKVLQDAGLLDPVEYQQRRQDILAMR